MNETVLPIVIAVIGSGAFSTIITAVINRIDKSNPMKVALRLLLQDKLTYLITKELDKGWTTTDTHKIIQGMYQTYKRLNGNGDMEWLMSRYNNLPLHTDERRIKK